MLTDEEKTNLKLLKFLYSIPTARLREERDECYKDITRVRAILDEFHEVNWDTLCRLEGKAEAIDEILKNRNAT
tara:strand:- start:417 stop:638 length:222 start_codon:yes stop_codon:yes gene_type:complete